VRQHGQKEEEAGAGKALVLVWENGLGCLVRLFFELDLMSLASACLQELTTMGATIGALQVLRPRVRQ
jgi:hypothetical protein